LAEKRNRFSLRSNGLGGKELGCGVAIKEEKPQKGEGNEIFD